MYNILLTYLLFFSFFTSGQNIEDCVFYPAINSANGGNVRLEKINTEFYEKYQSYYIKPCKDNGWLSFDNSDSIESALVKDYPLLFKKENNGFSFKDIGGNSISFKRKTSSGYPKSNSGYKIEARYNDFIIIRHYSYEQWGYIVVSLKNSIAYTLPGKPIFIDSELIYSFENYYDGSVIKIIDTKKQSDISMLFDDVEITHTRYSRNKSMGILFEFNSECKGLPMLRLIVQ